VEESLVGLTNDIAYLSVGHTRIFPDGFARSGID